MNDNFKRTLRTILGGVCLFIGVIFILVPGPAILFLPVGLALLSVDYHWAKVWLKKTQRWMRKSAVQTDRFFLWFRRKFIK
jgi:hypothetical protein